MRPFTAQRVSSERLKAQQSEQRIRLAQLQQENKILQSQLKVAVPQEAPESWLGIKLKIQVNQLKEQIVEKQNSIRSLKKSPHYTKQQESLILIDYLKHYTQVMKQDMPLMPDQKEELKTEIQELEVSKKILEEQTENYSIQKTLLEKKISQQYLDLDNCKTELKERQRVLRYLRKEMQKFEQKEQAPNQRVVVKKVVDLDEKKAEIIEKDQIIVQQEQIINQLKDKLQERTNYELKSKNQLLDNLSELQMQIGAMRQEIRQLTEIYYQEVQPLEQMQLPIIQNNKDHTFTILNDVYNKQETRYPRVHRVRQEQVQQIGKALSFRLQLKQVPIEQAIMKLINSQSVVSVAELQEALIQEPFCVVDQSESMMIARYMVEDTADDMVTLDPDRTTKVSIVKSVFRHLLGSYKHMSADQDKALWEEISGAIIRCASRLKSQFDIIAKNQSFMTPADFTFALDQHTELTDLQKDYILLRLFSYTNDLQKIMYSKLFDVFKPGQYLPKGIQ